MHERFLFILIFYVASLQLQAQKITVTDSVQHEFYDLKPFGDNHFLLLGVKSDDPPTAYKILNQRQTSFPFTPFLAIIDQNGKVIRYQEYPDFPSSTILRTITISGNHIIAGGKKRDMYSTLSYVAVFDTTLQLLNHGTWGSGEIYKIVPSEKDHFILCGESGKEILIAEFSAEGITRWSRTYPARKDFHWNEGYDLLQDKEKIFVVGSIASTQQENFGLLAVKNNGDTIFSRSYSSKRSDATLIRKTGEHYLLAGSFDSYKDVGYLVKTDENGDTLFTSLFGGMEVNINNCRDLPDSVVLSRWGKEQGVIPKDMNILPNGEIVLLCDVNFYSERPICYGSRKNTIGIFIFSVEGRFLRKSVLKTEHDLYAKNICLLPGDGLLISCNQKGTPEEKFLRSAFLYKTSLEKLLEEK